MGIRSKSFYVCKIVKIQMFTLSEVLFWLKTGDFHGFWCGQDSFWGLFGVRAADSEVFVP